MATNKGRKFDETSFNQGIRLLNKIAESGTEMVNNVYNATNKTSNTDDFTISLGKRWDPGTPFTIKTKKGRVLTGVAVGSKGDIGEGFELRDVKLGGEPIWITVSPKTKINNRFNMKKLAELYQKGENGLQINWPEIEYLDGTLDNELDRRYEARRKEYLDLFKRYKTARPDQQWDMAPQVAEALIKYNNLIK